MRDERTNSNVPSQLPTAKRCSGCGRVKPTCDFYLYRGDKLYLAPEDRARIW